MEIKAFYSVNCYLVLKDSVMFLCPSIAMLWAWRDGRVVALCAYGCSPLSCWFWREWSLYPLYSYCLHCLRVLRYGNQLNMHWTNWSETICSWNIRSGQIYRVFHDRSWGYDYCTVFLYCMFVYDLNSSPTVQYHFILLSGRCAVPLTSQNLIPAINSCRY